MSAATGLPLPPSPHSVNASSAGSAASFSYWAGIAKAAGGLLVALVTASFTGIFWAGGYLVRALAWLLTGAYAVASWPLTRLLALLRFLLSPVTHTLSYVLAPLVSFFYFLARLRPLYTYLGSAAFIGIVTGLVLKFAASYFFVVLQLDSDDSREEMDGASSRQRVLQKAPSHSPPRTIGRPGARPALSLPPPPPPPSTAAIKAEDGIARPPDDVWQWLEEFNPRQPVVAGEVGVDSGDAALLKRLSPPVTGPGGLLSLTIMEESSSE